MFCRETSRRIAQTLLALVSTTGLLGQGVHLLTGVHGVDRHGSCSLVCHRGSAHAHDCHVLHHELDTNPSRARDAGQDEQDRGVHGTHDCLICQYLALAFLNVLPAHERPLRGSIWQRTAAQIEPPDVHLLLVYSGRAPPTVA